MKKITCSPLKLIPTFNFTKPTLSVCPCVSRRGVWPRESPCFARMQRVDHSRFGLDLFLSNPHHTWHDEL